MDYEAQGAGRAPAGPAGVLDLVVQGAAVVAVWALVVTTVAEVDFANPSLRHPALFAHLVSLIVGFGAVVVIDVYGLLWVLGRRTAGEFVAMARATHILISAGLVGLVASGIVLDPNLRNPLAWIKLTLVLVVMVNGLNAHHLSHRLQAVAGHVRGADIPWDFVPRAFATAAVSQLAWWGALLIGFLTTTSRGT